MQATPHPIFDRMALILAVVGLATAATYIQVARPSSLGNFFGESIQQAQSKQAVAPVRPAAQPAPAAKPKTAPAPAKPAAKTATTISYVNLRAAKSTSSAKIANLEPGTPIQLRDDSDSKWQGVTYQGKKGYIFKSYIQY